MWAELKDWIVTIDGGAASGKSSVSREVAQRLGIPYVNTGLFYRALVIAVLSQRSDLLDEEKVMAVLECHPVDLQPGISGNRVFWQGEEITEQLHTREVDLAVSVLAKHPRVREWVTQTMRNMPTPLVAEGRDMGTVVFPEARLKFYLTASLEVRAQRRSVERPEDLEATLAALSKRDHLDKEQSAPASDAHVIDTSKLSLEGVVEVILDHIKGVRS